MDCRRFTSGPDRFVVETRGEVTKFCNKNLSEIAVVADAELFAVDQVNKRIYLQINGKVCLYDFDFRLIQEYPEAPDTRLISSREIQGICHAVASLLLSTDNGAGKLLHLPTNRFSQEFNLDKILFAASATRIYCFQHAAGGSSLQLRDITDELPDLFTWSPGPYAVLFAEKNQRGGTASDAPHELAPPAAAP